MIWLPESARSRQRGFILNPHRFGLPPPPNYTDHYSGTAWTGDGVFPRTVATDADARNGLIWIKRRNATGNMWLSWGDGTNRYSKSTDAGSTAGLLSGMSVTASGFTTASASGFDWDHNVSGGTYISYAMRKAAGFLDVVRYTGNGATSRAIPHTLGAAPGAILVVPNTNTNAVIGHQNLDATVPWTYYLASNSVGGRFNTVPYFGNTAPDASNFYVGQSGTSGNNTSGGVFTAFLFGSNPSETGRSHCFTYAGNASATGPIITCGWQPRWIFIKKIIGGTNSGSVVIDTTRAPGFTGADKYSRLSSSAAEVSAEVVNLTATGFQIATTLGDVNAASSTFVGIAIR